MINKILTVVAAFALMAIFSCTPKEVTKSSENKGLINSNEQSIHKQTLSLSAQKYIEMEAAALSGIDLSENQKNYAMAMVKECGEKRDEAKRMSDGDEIEYANRLKTLDDELRSSLKQELSTAHYNLYVANRQSMSAKIRNNPQRVWENRQLPAIGIDRSTPMSKREMLLQKLELTEEQMDEIEELEVEFEDNIRASMKSGAQNRDANKRIMDKLVYEKEQKIAAILTPTQFEQYKSWTKNGIPKHHRRTVDGNEPAHSRRGHDGDRHRMGRADRNRMGGGNTDPRMGNDNLAMERKSRMERDKLYQNLVLNDNQVLEMERIHSKYQDQSKRLREDNQGDRSAIREAIEAVQNSRIAEIRAVLNPNQLERYETWRKEMMSKRGMRRSRGGE